MPLWFSRQEFLSHPSPPSIPPHCSVQLLNQRQQQRASLVTAAPGYRLHLKVENKQSKTRCQLCQRILLSSQSGPAASSHPAVLQHPSSSHDRCLFRQRHLTSQACSLHVRQRISRAAFLSSIEQPNTTDSQDRQKTEASLCLGQALPLLVSAADISLDGKRIFKLQWQAGLSYIKNSACMVPCKSQAEQQAFKDCSLGKENFHRSLTQSLSAWQFSLAFWKGHSAYPVIHTGEQHQLLLGQRAVENHQWPLVWLLSGISFQQKERLEFVPPMQPRIWLPQKGTAETT